MWVCLSDAFLSIVEDTSDAKRLLVRARSREHLENVLKRVPGEHEIFRTPKNDYMYRTFLTRAEVMNLMQAEVMSIDYPNFKNSVGDNGLHDLYADFWDLHNRYQRRNLS